MEEKGDAKNCDQITLDEETTNESHQIYDLKTKVENLLVLMGKHCKILMPRN
jgi:hypothetical protein